MFEQSIVESGRKAQTNTKFTVLFSLGLQIALVVVFVIVPLIWYEVLPATQLSAALLAPPPPPPPPPPPAPKVVVRHIQVLPTNPYVAPKAIPKEIKIIKEEPPPPANTGVVGGVSSGSSGAGVVGGIMGGIPDVAPPPPPPATPSRIVVGGSVQEANCISCPHPTYPAIARSARIQGSVVLHAIISKQGTIENLNVVSGPPMLIAAAMQAVRTWRYAPTLLNNQPVEVDTQITVNFTLNQ